MEDILTFVKRKGGECNSLESVFKKARLDPMEYFSRKSSGIFLWVAVALSELSKPIAANHVSAFLNHRKRLTNAAWRSYGHAFNSILGNEADEDNEETKEKKEYISEILISWM